MPAVSLSCFLLFVDTPRCSLLAHLPPCHLATYDIRDLAHIREVSRVTFDEKQTPHWIAADEGGRRIVLN
jgi:hypothetical protein